MEARGTGAPQVPGQVVPPSRPASRLRFAQVRTPSPHGGGGNQGRMGRWSLSQRHAPPPPHRQKAEPPPPSVVFGARPASVTPADCSLAPCPGRACLAISHAGTCLVPKQQQQQ